jgi:hypothetical protein
MRERPYHQHDPIAATARSLPGQWVLVGDYTGRGSAMVTAQKIRSGQFVAYQPGAAYETEVRRVGEARPEVWVMYVGVPAEEAGL